MWWHTYAHAARGDRLSARRAASQLPCAAERQWCTHHHCSINHGRRPGIPGLEGAFRAAPPPRAVRCRDYLASFMG